MKSHLLILILLLSCLPSTAQDAFIVEARKITIVKRGAKYALQSNDMQMVLSDMDSIIQHNKQDVYVVKKRNKYGLYSLYGKEIIPVQYDKIERFFNQFWLVEANAKKGVYSLSDPKYIPAIWDDITFSGQMDAAFIVTKNNKQGVYSHALTELIPCSYDEVKNERGVIVLTTANHKKYLINSKIVNRNLQLEKSFQVEDTKYLGSNPYFVFEEAQKMGIIDKNNQVVLDPNYTELTPVRVSTDKGNMTTVLLVQKNEKWGMIDSEYQVVVPVVYESIAFLNSDYLIVETQAGKQFYDLKKKRLLVDISFDKQYYLGKYIRIEKDGKETLLDNATMKMVFPYKYNSISYLEKSNTFSVKLKDKYGIVDSRDKVLIPLEYDTFFVFSCGNKAVVEKDGLYGIIDDKNTVLLPFSDEYIIAYDEYFERKIENSFDTEKLDCNLQKMK